MGHPDKERIGFVEGIKLIDEKDSVPNGVLHTAARITVNVPEKLGLLLFHKRALLLPVDEWDLLRKTATDFMESVEHALEDAPAPVAKWFDDVLRKTVGQVRSKVEAQLEAWRMSNATG